MSHVITRAFSGLRLMAPEIMGVLVRRYSLVGGLNWQEVFVISWFDLAHRRERRNALASFAETSRSEFEVAW
jgi:hypothetical protein